MAETPPFAALAAKVADDLARLSQEFLAPGLYVVATPIGNLADITLRALSVLARADAIYCEDTRHSLKLLSHFAIRAPTRPYHEHNAEEQRPRILAELEAGKRLALISDAGTPLISDPGFKLVRDVVAAGHAAVSIPGASAVLTGLASSGLPTDAFFFAGFLPPRGGSRRNRIEALKAIPGTLVFFEAPTRVADTLADLAAVLGSRPGVVARELTKMHEEFRRGPLPELAAMFAAADEPKGEIVVLVGPPGAEEVTDAMIGERLDIALETQSLRDAAKAVADDLAVPKARVYDLGLKLRKQRDQE